MKKFFVVLGLALLNLTQKISLTRLVVTKLTGNGDFPAPDPPLATLTIAADEADAARLEAEAAKNTWAEKIEIQNQKEKNLDEVLTKEGKYVDLKADGDKAKIESAGMSASNQPAPVHLGQVDGLSLTRGDSSGEVDAHWHSIKKATGYTVEISTVAPDEHGIQPWTYYDHAGKSSITIKNRQSATILWVRVYALGSGDNKGAPSAPQFTIVP